MDIHDGKRVLEAEPLCGVDFCDYCGDCLSCYMSDPCPDGAHLWVVYEDQEAEFLQRHPGAKLEAE